MNLFDINPGDLQPSTPHPDLALLLVGITFVASAVYLVGAPIVLAIRALSRRRAIEHAVADQFARARVSLIGSAIGAVLAGHALLILTRVTP